jgi:hypothetical protein
MTIGLISHGIDKSRSQRNLTTGVSGATIVIAPYFEYEMSVSNVAYIDGMDKSLKNVRQCVKGGLVDQWVEEVQKFTGKNKLRVIQLYTANDIDEYTVREMIEADVIVVSSTILYDENYLAKLNKYSKTTNTTQKMNKIPKTMGAAPPETLEGFWIPYGRGTLYGAAQHTPIAGNCKGQSENWSCCYLMVVCFCFFLTFKFLLPMFLSLPSSPPIFCCSRSLSLFPQKIFRRFETSAAAKIQTKSKRSAVGMVFVSTGGH